MITTSLDIPRPLIHLHICHIATIAPGSPNPIPTPKAIFSLIDNPPSPPDDDAPPPPEVSEVSPVEAELLVAVGAKVGAVGPVGVPVASSCPQNPFTIDVADAMSAWEVLHPVAATEEAAEIAAEN